MENTGSIIIENMSMPQKGKVRVLVLRDDGRCVDEFGNVYKVVPGNRENRQPMYEELIKELRKESCGAKTTSWWRAADAIEELSGRGKNVPRWISATERLPKYGDWVLGIGPQKGYHVCEYRGITHFPYSGDIPWFSAKGRSLNITHWMPLPTPPKEET